MQTSRTNPHVDEHGNESYFNAEGKPHRVDGPAVTWPDGTEQWCINGKQHRLDGPAVYNPKTKDPDEYWVYGQKVGFSFIARLGIHLTTTEVLKLVAAYPTILKYNYLQPEFIPHITRLTGWDPLSGPPTETQKTVWSFFAALQH